ncbi:MAG: ABC transporter permease [Firmicutes bacterium]|nr:ABC transporter permease [Bacillota bacterium]
MSKLFSFQIIKRSFKSVWVWVLVAVFAQSVNYFAQSSQADNATELLANAFINGNIMFNGMIFLTLVSIFFSTALITNEVDRGTLAITLSTPITRKQILFSKGLVLVSALVSMNLLLGVLGSLTTLMFGIQFDHGTWWTVIALWLVYTLVVASIAFFIGCWFNKSRYAMVTIALILGGFYLLGMLSTIDNFEFLRFTTLQTLFNTDAVINGDFLWQFIALPLIAIPFFVGGAVKFLRKDLPL